MPACITALEFLCEKLDVELTVGGVFGDDLSGRVSELARLGLAEMETGLPLPDNIASINAYLGAGMGE